MRPDQCQPPNGRGGLRPLGRRRDQLLHAATIIVLLLPGCGNAAGAMLEGWRFESVAVTGHELVDGSTVSLWFVDGELRADGGCNTARGPYSINNGVLHVEDMSSTMMGCVPTELQDQDDWFGEFLRAGPSIIHREDQLTLRAADGSVVIDFAGEPPEPERPLVGTTWVPHSVSSGGLGPDASVSSGPLADDATLTLADDTTFEAYDGCNPINGRYQLVSDDRIDWSDVTATTPPEGCPDAEFATLMAHLLSGPVTINFDGHNLLMASDSTGNGLDFRPADQD